MKDIKKTFYIDELGDFYYEGLILNHYDMHDNFIERVVINKFILHYYKDTKKPYFCVNVNSLKYKTKNFTFYIEYLGDDLRKE